MERLYLLVVNRPRTLLVLLFLLTGVFGWYAKDIRLDSSVESLLSQDNPDSRYYAEVRRLFGSDEVGVVGLLADDIYTTEVLRKIRRLTVALESIEGVQEALSLTNALDPIADVVEPPPLVAQIPTEQAGLDALRETLADRPVYLKNLVSTDGKAAAINIFFADMDDAEFMARGIDEQIQAIIDQERATGPEQLFYTGLPRFKVYSARAMQSDLSRFVPLTLLAIVVVLFVSFRSLRGVLLPALTILVSLIWTLGIMVLAGSSLSLGSIALPPLILVLGTAYSLHMVAEYYELAGPDGAVRDVVLEALKKTSPPICITALTTVLGFLSLGVNPLASIRVMGVFSSVGILIAFLLSILLVPAALMQLRLPASPRAAFAPGVTTALQRIGRFAIQHRRSVIAAALLLAVVAIGKLSSIRVDSNFQSFFRPNDPVRQATDTINEHLVGSMAFYVVIDGQEKDIMKQWDTLRRIKDLQTYIDSLPGVDKTVSFVDYCELLDRGAQSGGGDIMVGPGGEIMTAPPPENPTTFWQEPSQLRAVMQLVAGSPTSFRSVASPDFARSNILVRTTLSGSREISDLAARISTYAREHFPPDLKVRPTGNLILLTETTGDIISGQIRSLSLAVSVIFVIMSAMFLSARVGLIAMIPNIFPIVIFFGLMGLSGAVLNLGTSIIAAIALGIAVDNTVHLMTRLSAEVHATPDQETALLHTLGTVGKPSLYASVILFLGFLVLYFSTFVPIREFGMLSAATMVVAFGADVLLLPALLATTKIITLWEVLYLKLGRDPQKTIPLFAGLRPVQAKIVTLMGEFRTFDKGDFIVRQGEMGREMFVLINGRADARLNIDGASKLLRTMGRGDVIGEMALIRQNQRTADVIAVDDAEAMVVDERFLQRMQKRYPRIGARIFLNIAKILSDRLDDASRRGVA